MMVLVVASVILYLAAVVWQCARVKSANVSKHGLVVLSLLAIAAHGMLLHQWIDLSTGQNLTLFNMFSLTAWMICLLIVLLMLKKPIELLSIFIFPIALFSILLVVIFPASLVVKTASNPNELFHILWAVITFCILCFAGVFALLLTLQDRLLRSKKGWLVMQGLPAIESMESTLFCLVGVGFVFLSVLLASSLYVYHALLLKQAFLLQKTCLVVLAWLVFALLLYGRKKWGWRGRRAVYGTLLGVLLLTIIYFGSKLLMQGLH